jgi:hypothetical protein
MFWSVLAEVALTDALPDEVEEELVDGIGDMRVLLMY